jgi:hypothetical protein
MYVPKEENVLKLMIMHVLRPLLTIFQFFVHCGQLWRNLYNPAISIIYQGKNKIIFNEMMISGVPIIGNID